MLKSFSHKLFQKKFDQKRKPFGKRVDRKTPGYGVITTLFKKGLTANFFKKSLIKNSVTFGFKSLTPKPYLA